MRKYLIIIAAALGLASCGGNRHQADDPLAQSGRTQRTENLLTNLKKVSNMGFYLFGHQDDPVSGVGWQYPVINSDVERVCHEYPALIGFDLGGIEKGDTANLDGVPFEAIRKYAIWQYDQAAMVTLSWTVTTDIRSKEQIDPVADFLNSLTTPYGVKVPVVLRLRQKQTKELWHLMVDRLKEKEVTNVLYAYSADADQEGGETLYLANYPGDDIIDIMGLDYYCDAPDGDSLLVARFAEQLDQKLTLVSDVAKKHQKEVALTETGYECVRVKHWWTKVLAPVLRKHPICYVLVWRNTNDGMNSYYVPFPGQHTFTDFVKFYNLSETFFIRNLNGLYLSNH